MVCVQLQRHKNPSIESRGVKPYADLPCGKCGQCLTNLGNEWKMRLSMEQRHSHSTYFLTLTYQDSEIPYSEHSEPTIVKDHIQKFIKRVRKSQDTNKSLKANWARTCKKLHLINEPIKKIRYYSVGEYGGRFDRPHYHIIFFNLYQETANKIAKYWTDPRTNNPYGLVDIQQITGGALDYVSKFHINRHAVIDNPKNKIRQSPFALMSRMPALGTEGIEAVKQQIYNTDELTINGIPQRMPQVFKNKLYPNDYAQIDLKNRKLANAKFAELRQIRKLQKEGFHKPLLELEDRAEAKNKMLIKRALKH